MFYVFLDVLCVRAVSIVIVVVEYVCLEMWGTRS
jgi:hypothetical protein